MLRRADNVSISFKPGAFSGKGWLILYVGARRSCRVAKLHKTEVAQCFAQQRTYPVRLASIDERTYWQFQDRFFWDNDGLDAAAVYALLVTRQQRQMQQVDRAQQIVAMGGQPRQERVRGAIPDDVRHLVWTRDGGRCRHCGSTVELQFDHIIPVSMSGSSQPENLQILCGPCNRRKGGGITVR